MKCYAKSSVNLIARLANLHPKTTFFIKVFSFVFLVPEKRIIFAKVQRRIKSKIRLSYRLSFKLLVVNQSNMLERKMELRHMQEMQELRSSLEKQEYFTFSQAARLMGVSRQYIYKLVKEEKLRASRLSGKMSLIRKADIELMLKSKPYERLVAKNDFDITEYYTAEEIAQKYKVNAKWVWTYTRQHKVPKVRIRQFNYYSKKHIDAAFARYEVDSDLTE